MIRAATDTGDTDEFERCKSQLNAAASFCRPCLEWHAQNAEVA